MRIIFTVLTTIAWALWLGGMVTLVIFVLMLFRTDRPTALQAAPRMFVTFGRYQLILAAAALVTSCLWRMVVKSGWITAIFAMFALAALGAVALGVRVVPRMEEMRLEGLADSAEYKRLHGTSTALYMGELAAMVIAGAILPAAIRAQRAGASPVGSRGESLQTTPASAQEQGSRGEAADRSTVT
jgi:hypothetical protein